MSLSREAHRSAEKGTQCSATKTPGDGLVCSQESVIILGNKWSWIDMLASFSWREAGKLASTPASPERTRPHWSSLIHLIGWDGPYSIWIKMVCDQVQTGTSSDSLLRVRNKCGELGNGFSNFGLQRGCWLNENWPARPHLRRKVWWTGRHLSLIIYVTNIQDREYHILRRVSQSDCVNTE